MAKHSSEATDPAKNKAHWNKILGLMEKELAKARKNLEEKITLRRLAIDATTKALEQVSVLESRIKDIKRSRDCGQTPKD